MSLINKEVNEFKVQAYVDNGFKEVRNERWFYKAIPPKLNDY